MASSIRTLATTRITPRTRTTTAAVLSAKLEHCRFHKLFESNNFHGSKTMLLKITVECNDETRCKLMWALRDATSFNVEQIKEQEANGQKTLTQVIDAIFSDGRPHALCDIKCAVSQAGFNEHSASPAISRLYRNGQIRKLQQGLYQRENSDGR